MNPDKNRDRLRAGLIARLPNLFEGVDEHLEQIYDLIIKFAARQDYEVTRIGFECVYSVIFKYLDIRSGTFMPSAPLMPALDFSKDVFFEGVLEKLKAIQEQATRRNDLEISRQILDCHTKIAIKATQIRYLTNAENSFHHAMLSTGYLVGNVEMAIRAGMGDIGFPAVSNLRRIGATFQDKKAQYDVHMVVNFLGDLSVLSLQTNRLLVPSILEAYADLLLREMLSGWENLTIKRILEKTENLIRLYHNVLNVSIQGSMDLSFVFGPLFDLSRPTALPYIYARSYQVFADPKTLSDTRKTILRQIDGFSEELWRFYDHLAQVAADKESFFLFYIDSNLENIIHGLLHFWQYDGVDDFHKGKFLERIDWLLSVYWRIYHYHMQITAHFHEQLSDHLIGLGMRFQALGLVKQQNETISILVSIAESFLEKEKSGWGFEAIRLLRKAALLALVSKEKTGDTFLKAVRKTFWKRLKEKTPEQAGRFFVELSETDPWKAAHENMPDNEDRLVAQLTRSGIDDYVIWLRTNLGE